MLLDDPTTVVAAAAAALERSCVVAVGVVVSCGEDISCGWSSLAIATTTTTTTVRPVFFFEFGTNSQQPGCVAAVHPWMDHHIQNNQSSSLLAGSQKGRPWK